MLKPLCHFCANEDGAVTVDWVVLTAATVALGFMVITTIARGATDTSSGLNDYLLNSEITSDY